MNHEIKHMLGGYLLETIKRKIRGSYTSNEFKSHGKYHTSPFSSFPLFFPRKIFCPLLSFLSKNPAQTPLLQPAFPLKIQLQNPPPLQPAFSFFSPLFLSSSASHPRTPSHLPPQNQPTSEALRKTAKIIILASSSSSGEGGLQICPSSVEFTSVKNMNIGMKRKCE